MTDLTIRRSVLAPISNVDYRHFNSWYSTALSLPTKKDDLAATAKKMRDLQQVVQSGRSLARATHWKWAEDEEGLEADWIHRNLSPEEFAQYVAWKEGLSPPQLDWAAIARISQYRYKITKRGRKLTDDLVPGLQILYPSKGIESRHAYYFSLEHSHALPLVSAVTKVQSVGIIFRKGLALWTNTDKAEMLTARRAAASGVLNIGRKRTLLDKNVRSIRTSIRIIDTREHALKWKVSAHEERLLSDGVA